MKICLGDNPFFGVNHLTGSKQLESQNQRFTDAALVVQTAMDHGCEQLMLSAHPSAELLVKAIEARCGRVPNLALVVPYPHRLNDIVAKGGYGALIKYLTRSNIAQIFKNIIPALGLKNLPSIGMKMLINAELSLFPNCTKASKHLALHNILVDMFVASGNPKPLKTFVKHSRSLGFEPVLITQNIESLVRLVPSADYTACFSFNSLGYMVNPSLDKVSALLRDESLSKPRLWAMQILAGGAIPPDVAMDFIKSHPAIETVLYATGNPERVASFFNTEKAIR